MLNHAATITPPPGQTLTFIGQNLKGRSFLGQNLTGADFSGAQLQGADFRKTNLTRANFDRANIQSANFTQAQLNGSNFTGASAGLSNIPRAAIATISTLVAIAAGLGECLGPSWIMNLLIFDNKLLRFGSADTTYVYSLTAGLVSLEILIVFLVITVRSGIGVALRLGGIHALTIGLPASTMIGVLAGAKVFPGPAGPGEASVGVGGAIAMAIFLSITSILLLALMATLQESYIWTAIASAVGILLIIYWNIITPTPPVMMIGMIIGAIILWGFSLFIARQSIANRPGYQSVRQLAIMIKTLFGTKFYGADLTQASFSGTCLKYTDLRKINATHTLWQNSRQLDWARVGLTILSNPIVRDLLVSGDGQQQSYIGLNLRGANLSHANLREANFSQADLSDAILQNADLQWATLTQTQAIAANFTGANLTGACGLATWNIDHTTHLGNIECRWIYLLETAKPNTDDRERRPSSGEFGPGEFTSLFREVINTIDLIFRNGIDQRAFSQSLQQLQSENNAAQLELQSLENKGNGTVIAKLKVSPTANKSDIHSQFTQFYQDAALKFNQQQDLLNQHIQTLYEKVDRLTQRASIDQFVLLQIHPGDFDRGFPITLQIFRYEDGVAPLSAQTQGHLPPNPLLVQSHQHWQSAYLRSLKAARLDVPSQITNISRDDFFRDCLQTQQNLTQQINQWLASDSFRPIERTLQINLDPDQPIRILLQTDHHPLRRLPWQTWRFFQDYPQAELALSKPDYHAPRIPATPPSIKQSVKILAILGDSRGIDLKSDRAALESLDADVTFLIEPKRHELSESLWNQAWDILFFAGHSHSQPDGITGQLWLNPKESLSIADLQYALTQAINHGLKLAIFNSCDGLGLANQLADLQIPQIIVMRQPVSDAVAQAFLKNFLQRFAQGQPFYQAVRNAREQLHDLAEQNPSASWLPVIIQNPAILPPTWQDFHRGK
ncbi:MAG: CHAT domain-containing protein [Alkalinema sp. RU_4_3]|nr:CHAT domain-containing protein [Alkalinema sp. RU_4_3]